MAECYKHNSILKTLNVFDSAVPKTAHCRELMHDFRRKLRDFVFTKPPSAENCTTIGQGLITTIREFGPETANRGFRV
jgi:hypothetical protein